MSKSLSLLEEVVSLKNFSEVATKPQATELSNVNRTTERLDQINNVIRYLPLLLKETRIKRSAATQIAFCSVLEISRKILNCSTNDIMGAYDLDQAFYNSLISNPTRLANISKEQQVEILHDLLRETHECKRVLEGKPRAFRTKLNEFICTESYEDDGFRAMSDLRKICPKL